MAKLVTLSSLRTRARERADQVNSLFCTDSEINGYLNKELAKLYDLLIVAYPDLYIVDPATTINVVAGTSIYALPSDFYAVAGVDEYLSATESITIKQYALGERNHYSPVNSNHTVKLLYIPAFADLSGDSSTFDSVNDWDDLAVVRTAEKMAHKEESYEMSDRLKLEADAIEGRLKALAPKRNHAEPDTITDVHRFNPNAISEPRLRYRLRAGKIHFVEYLTVAGNY